MLKKSNIFIKNITILSILFFSANLLINYPAWALSGAVEPTSALSELAPWILSLCQGGLIIICMYKGVHAFAEGRSIGGILIGLIVGSLLCFGGYYFLTHMGVSSSL